MPNKPESEVLQTAPNYGTEYLEYTDVTPAAPVCVPQPACCRGAACAAGLPCQAAWDGRGAAPCCAARRPAADALFVCRRFKNESEFVPESGYFSVDVPGVHIISLHSYVRPERMLGGLKASGLGQHGAQVHSRHSRPAQLERAWPADRPACLYPCHALLCRSCPGARSLGSTAGWSKTWRQVRGAGQGRTCSAGRPPASPTLPPTPPAAALDVSAVDRAATPFVVVGFHAAIYHSYVQQYKQADTFREVMEPLLVRHGVDLVLAGHVHRCVSAPAALLRQR